MRGFTLIELMIVVGVIAILSTLFMHNAQSSTQEARAVACEKNRTLFEDMEQKFEHDKGRPSHALQELVDAGYASRLPCPRAGVVTWTVQDESLPWTRQALVCSIHGPKTRIRKWIPPLAAADPAFAFSDSFDGPIAGNWTETQGRFWQLVDGKYRAGTTTRRSSGQHRAFSGDESWTDYDVNLNVNLLKGNGYGVYFRATGTKKVDGYVFEYLPNGKKFRMREVNNGRHGKVIGVSKAPKDFQWTGTERAVNIAVSGSTFTASVDGTKVVSGTSTKYKSGAVGIRSNNRAVTEFDEIQVETK